MDVKKIKDAENKNEFKNTDERENPTSDIENQNKKTHTSKGNTKKHVEAENSSGRDNIIDETQNRRPRDNA